MKTANNSSKINQAILNMPRGSVVTSEWLQKHDVSPKLAWWYVHSGWLEKISDKAYKKPEENITWSGVVYALQTQLNKPLHVSGKSALTLTGKAHYIPMADHAVIDIATETRIMLPTWFKSQYLTKDKIRVYQYKLLNSDDYKEFLIEREFDGLNILLSCNELAILEVLQLVPKHQDITEAAQLMEGLPYMRYAKVQSLLEKCTSIKAKRLYLHLATRYNHDWLKKLDLTKINLGRGKRMIVKGGNYDPVFKITMPNIEEE